MALVENGDRLPERESQPAERRGRVAIDSASDEVPETVAAEGVAADEDDVECHDESSSATCRHPSTRRPRSNGVFPEDEEHQDGEIEREAVQILKEEKASSLRCIDAMGARPRRIPADPTRRPDSTPFDSSNR